MCRVDGVQGRKHGACTANAYYEHIVEGDALPRPRADDSWTRERGYAVELRGDDWLFFTALEPAYAYGRAGHISAQVSGCSVREAVFEVMTDPRTGHEERTLHLLFGADHANRSAASDEKLLRAFVSGVTGVSARKPLTLST
ncbi:MAG: hypothetical protein ACTIA6_10790 [Pseudoclavibacter sp.]